MYTTLRLEYNGSITYLMIIVDDMCSNYDFLTYDFQKNIFVNESLTKDSFKTGEKNNINTMIEKINHLIKKYTLKSLMYENITEYEDMNIEAIHIPENYGFKEDEYSPIKV